MYYFSQYDDDHYYDGTWKNGKMEGKGKFVYPTGGVYEGEVKDGRRHGKGSYAYPNGRLYIGDWHDNL